MSKLFHDPIVKQTKRIELLMSEYWMRDLTSEEIHEIIEYFKSLKATGQHNIKEQTMRKALRNIESLCFRKGKVIFKRGDKSDAVYIIMRGKVEFLA